MTCKLLRRRTRAVVPLAHQGCRPLACLSLRHAPECAVARVGGKCDGLLLREKPCSWCWSTPDGKPRDIQHSFELQEWLIGATRLFSPPSRL